MKMKIDGNKGKRLPDDTLMIVVAIITIVLAIVVNV